MGDTKVGCVLEQVELVAEESVQIDTPNGVLRGTLYVLGDEAFPVPGLILGTGLGASRRQVHWLARCLSMYDLAVLTFDLPGHDDSPGTAGLRMMDDMRAAVRFMASHPAVLPGSVMVGGQCLCGSLAVHIAAEFEEVKAVFGLGIVPEHRVLRPYFWEYMICSVTSPEIAWPRAINQSEVRALLATMDVRQAVQRLRVPLLLIHYSEDRLCPVDVIRQVYDRASCPKRLALIDGGFHSAAYHDPQVASVLSEWIAALRQAGRLPESPRRGALRTQTA